MKRESQSSTDTSPFSYKPPEPPSRVRTKKSVPPVVDVSDTRTMTAAEIESLDMADLQKEAESVAAKSVRVARKTIKKNSLKGKK